MGQLYVVEQRSTGARRALKVLHAGIAHDERACVRFLEEARVGARIASDHVVQVIAAGVQPTTGTPWLAMELLDGEDLAAWVQREGLLSLDDVRAVLAQVGHALGAAHRAGVVHCDLKPENIHVGASRSVGAQRTVKVLDFGIARTLQTSQTAAVMTTAMGSPLWMSPEQAQRGSLVRPSADVWALGLLVFYLLTGRFYWRTAQATPTEFNLQALLVEMLVDPIVPARERASGLGAVARLPASFDAWFARCVVREPEQRFRDADAALAALWPVLDASAPTDAPEPPPRPAAGPWQPTVVGSPSVPASVATVRVETPLVERTPATVPPENTVVGGVRWTRVAVILALFVIGFAWACAIGLSDPGLRRG